MSGCAIVGAWTIKLTECREEHCQLFIQAIRQASKNFIKRQIYHETPEKPAVPCNRNLQS